MKYKIGQNVKIIDPNNSPIPKGETVRIVGRFFRDKIYQVKWAKYIGTWLFCEEDLQEIVYVSKTQNQLRHSNERK